MQQKLYLTEIFRSVQGETSFVGLPTTFIRLSGCNLRCTWCDTAYSFKQGDPRSIDQIIQQVELLGCHHVCITGGEPLLQKEVIPLMTALCDLNYNLSIETGGSLPITSIDPRVHIILDIKCPGSGMEGKNHWENLQHLTTKDEVKFVVKDAGDYAYAKSVVEMHGLRSRVKEILFSPVFGVLDPQQLVGWILEDQLPYRLNLQIHKWIWEPATQGV